MGCQKSLWLRHNDGRDMIIHVKFAVGEKYPTTEYKIAREHRTHSD